MYRVGWSLVPGELRTARPIEGIEDADVRDGRVLLVGTPFREGPTPSAEVAWIGTIDGKLADLEPVHHLPAVADR